MNSAYFDCFSGAGGDMIVASLVHAGADETALTESLASLGLDGYSLSITHGQKQGFASVRFHVALAPSAGTPHRHLKDIEAIIGGSPLPDPVKDRSRQVFERLAKAEAKVHGTTVDKVHFHEVGAVDSILDIVGAIVALDLLNIQRVVCSPMRVGSGTVRCDHGVMPIPAPATAELLKGVPIEPTAQTGELLTPTAAAIFTTIAESFGPMPELVIESIGYGAGTRDGDVLPNVLRVLVGRADGSPEASSDRDSITVLETNIDDATPEVVGYCLERLLAEGALDAYAVPIHMKKSRTGVLLAVLCRHADADAMEGIVFSETSTLGIRRHRVERKKLPRRAETVTTPFGDVRVKVVEVNGAEKASPEYDDCKGAARLHHVPLQEVVAAARAAWVRNNAGQR